MDIIYIIIGSISDYWSHLSFLERFFLGTFIAYVAHVLIVPARKERP